MRAKNCPKRPNVPVDRIARMMMLLISYVVVNFVMWRFGLSQLWWSPIECSLNIEGSILRSWLLHQGLEYPRLIIAIQPRITRTPKALSSKDIRSEKPLPLVVISLRYFPRSRRYCSTPVSWDARLERSLRGVQTLPRTDNLLGYVSGILSLGPSLNILRIGGATTNDSGPPAPITTE